MPNPLADIRTDIIAEPVESLASFGFGRGVDTAEFVLGDVLVSFLPIDLWGNPMPYDRGDLVRFVATFVASGNTPADPSQIYYLSIDPGGNRATHKYGLTPSAIVRSGTGAYYIDNDLSATTAPGIWNYRWEGTGGVQAAVEQPFRVNPTFKL